MSCNETRQTLLEIGCTADGRTRAAQALEHLKQCDSCREAMADFDKLTAALGDRTVAEDLPVVPSGGWEQFNRRISRPASSKWGPIAIAGIAAAILIALLLRPMLPGRTLPNQTADANGDDTMIQFTPHDVDRRVQAFDQVAGVFDRRASWLLVADNASDMGVSDAAIDSDEKLLLLRLTMLRAGKIISNADLIIVAGQSARLTVPLGEGVNVEYAIGTSADEPSRLSIWAQLMTPQGRQSLAALATSLQVKSGEKYNAGTMVTSAGGYDLKIAFRRARTP
jgi:hypothetical protein